MANLASLHPGWRLRLVLLPGVCSFRFRGGVVMALYAFHIYAPNSRRRVGIEMFEGYHRTKTERDKWRYRGYGVGIIYKSR